MKRRYLVPQTKARLTCVRWAFLVFTHSKGSVSNMVKVKLGVAYAGGTWESVEAEVSVAMLGSLRVNAVIASSLRKSVAAVKKGVVFYSVLPNAEEPGEPPLEPLMTGVTTGSIWNCEPGRPVAIMQLSVMSSRVHAVIETIGWKCEGCELYTDDGVESLVQAALDKYCPYAVSVAWSEQGAQQPNCNVWDFDIGEDQIAEGVEVNISRDKDGLHIDVDSDKVVTSEFAEFYNSFDCWPQPLEQTEDKYRQKLIEEGGLGLVILQAQVMDSSSFGETHVMSFGGPGSTLAKVPTRPVAMYGLASRTACVVSVFIPDQKWLKQDGNTQI